MRVTPTLRQVQVRLERASEHKTALKTAIEQWETSNQRSVVLTPSYDPVDDVYTFSITQVPDQSPLLKWGTWIGDCLYNIRSGLDYLAWHAAVKSCGGPPAHPNRVIFPITRDPNQFRKVGVQFSAQFTRFFESFQPFVTEAEGYEPALEENPLVTLQHLSNDDKHRLITPVLWRQGAVYMPLGVPSGAAAATATNAPVKVGEVIFRVRRRVLTYPSPPKATRLTPFVVMQNNERVPALLSRLIKTAKSIQNEAAKSGRFEGGVPTFPRD